MTPTDLANLRLALSLAYRGLGNTAENPSVGCVLTRPDLRDRIVGRGWTQPSGRPHAEAMALQQAGEAARGATAYVTLEPCSHTGRTPPCADALISAGIARVVCSLDDPDERVAGRGFAKLRESGIVVETGGLANEAAELLSGYLRRKREHRPHVTLKLAMTADGRIATRSGDSQWITGERARREGHALRARHDAILTGSGTVIADDPSLTCRLPGLEDRSPAPVVMVGARPLPSDRRLMRRRDERPVRVFEGHADPAFVLQSLAEDGINTVMIEAGSAIAGAFLQADLVDEVFCFRAAKIIGGDGLSAVASMGLDRLGDAKHFRLRSNRVLDGDALEHYTRA